MTLLAADDTRRLVQHWNGLTLQRREFLLDFMASLSPVELEQMLACDSTPPEEVQFIRACCGLEPLEATTLRSL